MNKKKFQLLSTALVILMMMFSLIHPSAASAQTGDGIRREVNAGSGRISFIGPESGSVVSASRALGTSVRPQDPAMALAIRFGPEFGIQDPERDLSEMKRAVADDGRISVRYQQNHQGIPVMGGELIVNTNEAGDLYSVSGEASVRLPLQTQPTFAPEQAAEQALQALAKWNGGSPADFVASEPALWIYDESLLMPSTRPAELVWRMEVTSTDAGMPLRELVLVNAQRGNISLHFNQIDTAWHAPAKGMAVSTVDTPVNNEAPVLGNPLAETYTANNTSSLPGTFLCNQSTNPCTSGGSLDLDANAAHQYAIGTYYLYSNVHLRDSIDNAGMKLISTVHFQSGYANAFWNSSQMVYGDAKGFAQADDVVAHELTHGVTEHESNLFYYYQSGAINESLSDVWGEYYDQTNSLGDDSPGVKWQMGEDVTGLGAIRSMNNPPAFGDPDKMTSPNYYTGSGDNGGVHWNSGINNKAVYLMVDGDSFNSKTVTSLGWAKTIAIYYEAQTKLLTSGADYSDLYYALQQACKNLIGQKGITSGDCNEVKDAGDAVEMNGQPVPNFNTNAPLCDVSKPFVVFADDLETGTGNWTFTNNNPANTRWQWDSPYGAFAQSGTHFLYADDYPASITDASARLTSFVVPPLAYMHFAHAYDFDSDSAYYDGGVLEYSTNNGVSWADAGPLMDYNGYNGTISPNYDNPLKGRPGFVGISHGYTSTRLNLAPLAGQTVSFRWRMGLDSVVYFWGWWLDNVKVYTCNIFADVPASYWAWDYVERLYNSGVTGGCTASPLNYCPDSTVTRAQMAVFLLKGIHGSNYSPPAVGGSTGFADVPTSYWAAPWIKQLAAEGVTGGCGGGNFCPDSPVTRAQMAVFLLKSKHGVAYLPPAATGVFTDVPVGYWADKWIEQLAAEGITGGCGGSNYCPDTSVTRAQMAVFLVKTFNLP